ncbi:MAG: CPBP family intramembrane glutamic endopeptidase [Phycisphaeraceae bacterium]
MWDALQPIQRQLVIFTPVAAVVVLALIWSGPLRPRALDAAPPRDVGLRPIDLCVGLFIFFFGALLEVQLSQVFGLFPLPEAAAQVEQPSNQVAAQTLLHQFLTGMPVLIYLMWRAVQVPGGLRKLGLLPSRPVREMLIGVVGVVVCLPLLIGIGTLAVALGILLGDPAPRIGHDLLQALVDTSSPWATAGILVSAVVLAPVFEEAMFRGLIQTTLLELGGRRKRWSVVVIVAAWFALIHLGVPWQALPVLFVLGLILGWLYERTGSLLPSVLVHVGFNAFNVGYVLLVPGVG